MTGHSQTRWHWGDPEGVSEPPIPWCGCVPARCLPRTNATPPVASLAPPAGVAEPPIPWHSHLYPDLSPVSYTEAAAIREYTTGQRDFLALDTFLAPSPDAPEAYLTLSAAEEPHALHASMPGGAMLELTFWPQLPGEPASVEAQWPAAEGALRVRALPSTRAQAGWEASALEVVVNATAELVTISTVGGAPLASHDIRATGKPEGGIVANSWNLLRLLLEPGRARVWLNPQFPDGALSARVLPIQRRRPLPTTPLMPRPTVH